MNLVFNWLAIIVDYCLLIIRKSIKNSLTISRKLHKIVKQDCAASLWLFLHLALLPVAGFMAGRW